MTKANAVKMIMDKMCCGLPAAIKIYNYLTAYGEIEFKADMLERMADYDEE